MLLDLGIFGNPPIINGYAVVSGNEAAVVDSGPASVARAYAGAARERLGGARIKALLLTHVHVDHAGGAAYFTSLPDAPVAYVHRRGAPHLVDPTRLNQASRSTLGGVLDYWGEAIPVPEGQVAGVDDGFSLEIGSERATLIYMPGHASHSAAWYFEDEGLLFIGDSAGMLFFGEGGFLWPAAPPPFFMEEFKRSIGRAMKLKLSKICFPHFGCSSRPYEVLEESLRVYERTSELVSELCSQGRLSLEGVMEGLGYEVKGLNGYLRAFLEVNLYGLPGYSSCRGPGP